MGSGREEEKLFIGRNNNCTFPLNFRLSKIIELNGSKKLSYLCKP